MTVLWGKTAFQDKRPRIQKRDRFIGFLIGAAVLLLFGGGTIFWLYLFKGLLGIDLFPDSHLLD